MKTLIMDNNKLFKALVNSQSLMKSELLGEIGKLRKETEKGFKEVNEKIDNVDKNLTNRIDLLGKQLNTLDEDAPTGEDFSNLVTRVTKLENQYFVTA